MLLGVVRRTKKRGKQIATVLIPTEDTEEEELLKKEITNWRNLKLHEQ